MIQLIRAEAAQVNDVREGVRRVGGHGSVHSVEPVVDDRICQLVGRPDDPGAHVRHVGDLHQRDQRRDEIDSCRSRENLHGRDALSPIQIDGRDDVVVRRAREQAEIRKVAGRKRRRVQRRRHRHLGRESAVDVVAVEIALGRIAPIKIDPKVAGRRYRWGGCLRNSQDRTEFHRVHTFGVCRVDGRDYVEVLDAGNGARIFELTRSHEFGDLAGQLEIKTHVRAHGSHLVNLDGQHVRARDQRRSRQSKGEVLILDRDPDTRSGEGVICDRPHRHVGAHDFDAVQVDHSSIVALHAQLDCVETRGIRYLKTTAKVVGREFVIRVAPEREKCRLVAVSVAEFRGAGRPRTVVKSWLLPRSSQIGTCIVVAKTRPRRQETLVGGVIDAGVRTARCRRTVHSVPNEIGFRVVDPIEQRAGIAVRNDESRRSSRSRLRIFENRKRVDNASGRVDVGDVESVVFEVENHRPQHLHGQEHHRMVQETGAEPAGVAGHNMHCTVVGRRTERRLHVSAITTDAPVATVENHRAGDESARHTVVPVE